MAPFLRCVLFGKAKERKGYFPLLGKGYDSPLFPFPLEEKGKGLATSPFALQGAEGDHHTSQNRVLYSADYCLLIAVYYSSNIFPENSFSPPSDA